MSNKNSLRIMLCSLIAIAIMGCNHRKTRIDGLDYAFDPKPVPILANLGIAHSVSARLGTSVSGEVYLLTVYGNQDRLGLVMSHNEGDTFMPPAPISDADADVTMYGEATPNLAVTPTDLYAEWQQTGAQGASDLLVTRASPWGLGFSKPVNVVEKEKPSFNGFSTMAVAPNGDVYVVWLDGRDRQPPVPDSLDPTATFSVYIARSSDQGASFGPNVRIALGACPCCRPTLAFGAHGEVFVAWRKVFPGDFRDMVVATSRDHGMTFTQPVRIAADHWKLAGCPDSGPSLAVDGSRLYAAWMSEGDNKPGIRLAYSDDGAQSFSKPVIVSRGVFDPNHPSLAVSDDGSILLAFQGRDPKIRNGWGDLGVYLVTIAKSAISRPLRLPGSQGSASYPAVVAAGAGRVYVAWTERTESGSRVVLLRGRLKQQP